MNREPGFSARAMGRGSSFDVEPDFLWRLGRWRRQRPKAWPCFILHPRARQGGPVVPFSAFCFFPPLRFQVSVPRPPICDVRSILHPRRSRPVHGKPNILNRKYLRRLVHPLVARPGKATKSVDWERSKSGHTRLSDGISVAVSAGRFHHRKMMEPCLHGSGAPREVLVGLPGSQGGRGRHKCTICAYALGLARAQTATSRRWENLSIVPTAGPLRWMW